MKPNNDNIMTATNHQTINRSRQRRRSNSGNSRSILSKCAIAASCLLIAKTATTTTTKTNLPWPCIFASASVTQRIASSLSQSSSSTTTTTTTTSLVQHQFTRALEDVQYDDDAANAAMEARDEAQAEGDDGFVNFDNVDFGETSIMPVSCVN